MLALNDYENHAGFTESEKTAVAFSEELTLNPPNMSLDENPLAVSEAVQQRLRDNFDEKEILELVMGLSVFNYMNRFNRFMEPDVDMELPPQELIDMMGPKK